MLAILLVAWRSEAHRLLGKPDSATPAVARGPVPLSFSEPEEVVPDERHEGSPDRRGGLADEVRKRLMAEPAVRASELLGAGEVALLRRALLERGGPAHCQAGH